MWSIKVYLTFPEASVVVIVIVVVVVVVVVDVAMAHGRTLRYTLGCC